MKKTAKIKINRIFLFFLKKKNKHPCFSLLCIFGYGKHHAHWMNNLIFSEKIHVIYPHISLFLGCTCTFLVKNRFKNGWKLKKNKKISRNCAICNIHCCNGNFSNWKFIPLFRNHNLYVSWRLMWTVKFQFWKFTTYTLNKGFITPSPLQLFAGKH